MSAVFRRVEQGPIEDSDSWLLESQIAAVTDWLDDPSNALKAKGRILDIGFNSRLGDEMVMVQGETIPLDFMKKLVANENELWLSIYPAIDEGQ